tara:strand:+ start:154 stop:909 length:756 start_codon:yes stop_codon:yes gene_type:complete
MKKIISYSIVFYLTLINLTLASQSVDTLKSKIISKGAIPLIKTDIDDDDSYEELLKTQYEFILKEEIKIIKDIKIAENSCKIMGYKPGFTKKNKKKFNTCVLEVWQARLIGKKFVSMQSEIDTKDFTPEELQKYFNDKLDEFNSVRSEQLKKNKKFKKKFQEIGIKDKLENVDYEKIVIYAIGIVAAYYIGKTILDSLDDAKAAKDIAQTGSSSAGKTINAQHVTFCNYGKMLYLRYRIRHGSLAFCSKLR